MTKEKQSDFEDISKLWARIAVRTGLPNRYSKNFDEEELEERLYLGAGLLRSRLHYKVINDLHTHITDIFIKDKNSIRFQLFDLMKSLNLSSDKDVPRASGNILETICKNACSDLVDFVFLCNPENFLNTDKEHKNPDGRILSLDNMIFKSHLFSMNKFSDIFISMELEMYSRFEYYMEFLKKRVSSFGCAAISRNMKTTDDENYVSSFWTAWTKEIIGRVETNIRKSIVTSLKEYVRLTKNLLIDLEEEKRAAEKHANDNNENGEADGNCLKVEWHIKQVIKYAVLGLQKKEVEDKDE